MHLSFFYYGLMLSPLFVLVTLAASSSILKPGSTSRLKLMSGTTTFSLLLPKPTSVSDALKIYTEIDEKHLYNQFSLQFVLMMDTEPVLWRLDEERRSKQKLACLNNRRRRFKDNNNNNATLIVQSQRNIDVWLQFELINIGLPFGSSTTFTASPSSPATFVVDPVSLSSSSRLDRYILTMESLDEESSEICAILAVYEGDCKFLEDANNIRNSHMWLTALAKGAMTIRYEHFSLPFYVSIVVLEDDDECRSGEKVEKMEPKGEQHFRFLRVEGNFQNDNNKSYNKRNDKGERVKEVSLRIDLAPSYETYVKPIVLTISFSVILVVFAALILSKKRLGSDFQEDDENNANIYPNLTNNETRNGMDTIDEINSKGDAENAADSTVDSGQDSRSHDEFRDRCRRLLDDRLRLIDDISENRLNRISKGLNRLRDDAKVSDMTQILQNDVWFRRNRSRVYCYLVPLLSLFYFIPSIQFVFLVKQRESETGSQDLCFHNFECSRPLNVFADFNHVISNVHYMIFGVGFSLIVLLKARRLPKTQNPSNDHKSNLGIPQQLSIFYAMGFALIAQGFFSICYHVCPTNQSLQFDSTMMYVMCMLGIVKLYQFRHPDANANAYSFFFYLGAIVLLEALALYFSSWWLFLLFLLFYVITVLLIAVDCYFIGVARLDRRMALQVLKEIINLFKCREERRGPIIRYKERFAFSTLFCAINMSHAIYTAFSKYRNPQKSVTHVVLLILGGNLFLYIAYYVLRKNGQRCEPICKYCCLHYCKCIRRHLRNSNSNDEENDVDEVDEGINKQSLPKLPYSMPAGTFFALFSILLGIFASLFYVNRSANRNLSPAESRELNEQCGYFDFFDNHDMWHLTGAAAIFMAFLALLTLDDDLLNVPRERIDVF